MSAHAGRFAAAVGAGSLVAAGSLAAAALLTAPDATAGPLPSNCLPGAYGQLVYCDEDVNPDGSWVRCKRPTPAPLTVFGGMAGSTSSGPAQCQLVRANALPAGSPPYHIGYGGEATGRV